MKTKKLFNPFFLVALFAALTTMRTAPAQSSPPPASKGQELTSTGNELTWPREFLDNGTKVDIYQPEIEKWEGTDFETRSAVALTPPGSNAPVYGVFWMKARADVDKSARIVTLNDIQVTRADFPSAPASQAAYLALIRKHVPTLAKTVALDHLEASYAISEAAKKASAVPVKNTPPRIIYSANPSLLILIDGPPALRPTSVSDVQRVINSQALILKKGSVYYLYAWDQWYQAVDLNGLWTLATAPPQELETARQAAVASQSIDLMAPGTNSPSIMPTVFVSTVPAELVQTEGIANLVPIEGTDLMQVKNTDSALFLYNPNQRFYVLLSGRWFEATSLYGPWGFVPYNELPKDFAKIPPTHPKANVLVSVPGTEQANEAVIANSIPQTATVQRNEARLDLSYDGEPQFQPIAGTPLLYAVNTATPVIEVDPKSYYSVQNGVWFVAASPTGPWSVATSVPAVIYSIPPSSPLHYVTYAQVYGSTPDTVDVGYTPGYLGTEVSPDGVVVYGTGYDYPPYIGNSWIGSPYTYGFGVGFADNWDVGFGFGFGAGCWLGTWCHPWWGPFAWGRHHHFDYTHVSLNHIDIYHHWAPGVVHVEHNYGFNAWNGRQWSHTWSTHFNPYSSRAANLSPVQQTRAYDGNFRSRALQPTGPPRTTYSFNNNVYAGRDGNVYRYNPSGSWERNSSQAWHPAPQVPRVEQQQLEIGRSMGEQRFNNYRSYGGGFSHPAPAFGGGHFGGGGHR